MDESKDESKKGRLRKIYTQMREGGKKEGRELANFFWEGKDWLNLMRKVKSENKEFFEKNLDFYTTIATAMGSELMKIAKKENYMGIAMIAAQLYEEVGRGHNAVNKLKSIYETHPDQGSPHYKKVTKPFVEEYIKKHSRGHGNDISVKDLASKLGVFLGLILGGAGLGMVTGNFTGFAISNSTTNSTAPGLAGIVFLVIGLVGSFFYFKLK